MAPARRRFPSRTPASAVNFSALYHNTFVPYYRSQEGAVPAGTTVTLRLQTAHLGATGVNLRVYLLDTGFRQYHRPHRFADGFLRRPKPSTARSYDYYTIDYTTPSTPTIVYYKFEIFNGSGTAWYSDDYIDDYDNLNKDGTGAATATEPFDSFQITAYDPNFQTPAWMANANVYHIFPDRFRHGNPTNEYCVARQHVRLPVVLWRAALEQHRRHHLEYAALRSATTRTFPAITISAASSMAATCWASRTSWIISRDWASIPCT